MNYNHDDLKWPDGRPYDATERLAWEAGWEANAAHSRSVAPPRRIDISRQTPIEAATHTTPAEGRGEEAGRDRCGPMSFGVVDCDGVLYADYRENAERRVRVLNDSGIAGTPYRVVPLYARSLPHGDGAGKERRELDVERAIRFAASNCPGWPLYPDALRVFIDDALACGRGELDEEDGYNLENRVAEVRRAAGGGE